MGIISPNDIFRSIEVFTNSVKTLSRFYFIHDALNSIDHFDGVGRNLRRQ